jgi:molybdate transport system substrate-binding protein
MTTLHLLCAGAAQGLVKALQERFMAEVGAGIEGRFGAVGALKEALLGGESCDVVVVTQTMIDGLVAEGWLRAGSSAALGRVHTGIAVQQGAALPDVGTPEGLKAALLAASAVYFPDPERATAGIHFANVMRELGIHDTLRPRFRTHPNGATAMREMAACGEAGLIGCTQASEILYSPGVVLAGALPKPFELATVYTAATASAAADPALADRFIALLSGADTLPLRLAGGFEA